MDRYPDMNHSLLRDILQPGFLIDGRKQVSRKIRLGTQIAGLEMHLAPARANYIGNYGLWGGHPNSSCDSVFFCYALGNFGGVGCVSKQYLKVFGCLAVGYFAHVCHCPRRN